VPDGVVQYIEKRGLYRGAHRRPGTDARGAQESPDGRPAGTADAPNPPAPNDHLQEVPR